MPDRPRLLVLASTYPRWHGDTEPGFVHELSRRLCSRFNVTVIAPHFPGALKRELLDDVRVVRFRYAPSRWERLTYEGGILTNLRHHPSRWLLVPFFLTAQLFKCIRQLKHERPTAIHAHWILPQGLIAVLARRLARVNVPILVTSHGADLFGLRGVVGRLLKSYTLRRIEMLTVVSRAMRNLAADAGMPNDRIAVTPMGVDLRGRFTPRPGIQRDARTLVFVGRLVEKKGVSVLIEAFSRLTRIESHVRLRIIGEGPERQAIERQIDELNLRGQVDMIGALPQERLPEELSRATALVMPSIQARSGDQEGLGLVQVEAMGCECPVVSTDLPAIRDVIVHERTGLLAASGDAEMLFQTLHRLIKDDALRLRLAKTARRYAFDRFDWSVITKAYSGHLEALADNNFNSSSSNSSE